MNSDDQKRLALELLDAISTRDVDAVLARMTEDPSWGFFAQQFPGADGVRAILKAASELYEPGSEKRDIHAVYCDGDTVIVKTSMRARTFKGDDYENLYIMIVHFEGEKIRLVEEFMDTAYGNEKFSGWEMSE
jgi:ketosteroid isomerase-like protein